MPRALLRSPHVDCALPGSCLVPQPYSLVVWVARLLPGAPLHRPGLRLLIKGFMCLQELGLKSPGSPRGRYLKVAWVGQNWGSCERENPPYLGGAGSCWNSGNPDPDLVRHRTPEQRGCSGSF